MGEVGCLKDGHFQNLQVENTTILDTGDITISGTANTVTIPGTIALGAAGLGKIDDDNRWGMFGMTSQSLAINFGAVGDGAVGPTTALMAVPVSQLVPVARYIAVSEYIKSLQAADSSITAAQARLLMGLPTATASTQVAVESDALAGTWCGADVSTVVLTGGITEAVASTASTSDVQTVGMQQLVLFHNVTMTHGHTLTLTTHADSELLAACGKIYVSDTDGSSGIAGVELETTASQPTTADNTIIIAPTGTGSGVTTILPGSFLYFNRTSTATDINAVHGVLLTSGGVVAITFA